uniref:Uncharacterized protein n=1 Tax=Arundo donax TaxID=35708 RepID=A0A0A8YVQ6_ARUDO
MRQRRGTGRQRPRSSARSRHGRGRVRPWRQEMAMALRR